MTFASALQSQFEADPALQANNPRLYRMLTAPDSPRKRRRMRAMEHAVRVQQGLSDSEAIDWSKVDWSKILVTVLQVLAALLPFLLLL